MSQSPIEFLGEEPGHDVPDSEYGGADGLIQPALPDPRGASGGPMLPGHDDDALMATREGAGEMLGMMARRANVPLGSMEAVTGIAGAGNAGPGGEVLDPETGRVVPVDANKTGGKGAGELSDQKPGG